MADQLLLTLQYWREYRTQLHIGLDFGMSEATVCRQQHPDLASVIDLILTVNNGSVEGLNNRLKMLKRQIYGRAGQDLLAKRLIAPQLGAV